ncbi:MAG: hypothetical protein ACREXY_01320 [Gammaproteobacteria bacterium]
MAEWSFHSKPYRHYRYNDQTETPNGLEILSVTQALGVLDKSGPLQGYAARETVRGVSSLLWRAAPDATEIIRWATDPPVMDEHGDWSQGRITYLLKREGLTFRDRTSDAAARGTAVHKALEDWINEQRIPRAANYPAEWQGYFRGLASWLAQERPDFEESELVVGSTTHGYAGTRDTVARVRDKRRGLCLLDAKTSKAIHPSSMFRQLVAYDEAGAEGGEARTDSQGIIRFGSDGSWEIKWLQDFGLPRQFWLDAFLHALTACRDEREISTSQRQTEDAALKAAGWFPMPQRGRWARTVNGRRVSEWRSKALRVIV